MSVLDTRTIPNFVMLPFTQSRVSNSDKASARLQTTLVSGTVEL